MTGFAPIASIAFFIRLITLRYKVFVAKMRNTKKPSIKVDIIDEKQLLTSTLGHPKDFPKKFPQITSLWTYVLMLVTLFWSLSCC
ncbi:MAG: hypothetical protein LBF17_01390, partial [Mediterranea sp.]|nr:hypothetical protein [Mediterranea sp.]